MTVHVPIQVNVTGQFGGYMYIPCLFIVSDFEAAK